MKLFLLPHLALCTMIACLHAQTGPIQDNSFLLEEAYNQEPGVIQHISTFTRQWNSDQWVYTFTQEWPVPDHWRNQLSYTLTDAKAAPDQTSGIGDVLINYRYQVAGSGDTKVAVAPRLSLIVPSGSAKKGTGFGGTGIQTNLPASLVFSKFLVGHTNLGGTWIPTARNANGDTAASYGYFAGQSFIWLAKPRLNAMLECIWNSSRVVSGPAVTQTENSLWLVPGIRWAHNFRSGLQIVPGVGFVTGAGPSQGQNSVMLYLSFEHPLWRESE